MTRPALVLLPGMDGTGSMFAPFVSALPADTAVTVVRYPTDRPLGYAALETIARAALPTTGQYVLLGESFSGPIAISIAASPPRGLAGIVLCCTFAMSPVPAGAWLRRVNDLLPAVRLPVVLFSGILLGRFASPQLRAMLGEALSRVAPTVFRHRLSEVLSVDVRSRLDTVAVPILSLEARHDRVVGPQAGRLIAALKPTTQRSAFDAPHLLLQCRPLESARAVEAFMAELELAN